MNPIQMEFPNHFETTRLHLRCPIAGDGTNVHEAVMESIDSLKLWMNFVNPVPTLERLEEHGRLSHAHFITREDLQFYVFGKENQRFLGSVGLHRPDWKVRKFEIGYWLRHSATGQGVMTEAVNGLTQFASDYLKANRLEIRCDPRNAASRKVAERCGYHLEAVLLKNYVNPTGLSDDCVYTKVRLDDGTLGYPIA